MSFTLVINSSNVVNTNTNATYQYNFIGGNFVVEDDTYVMLSSAQIPYSIFNITSAYNNNRFTLGFPTGSATNSYTTFSIVFPDGFYTIEDIRGYIQQFCIANGLYLINADLENVYYIDFQVDTTYYANQILLYTVPRSLPSGWTQPSNWIGYSTFSSDRTPYVQFNQINQFHEFLGFNHGVYPSGALTAGITTNYSLLSNRMPPIGSYVNSIIVHCSLVNNNVVSPSDIIDAFQITNTTFGSNINYAPSIEKFVKLTKGSYSSMIVYLTDQNNNPINLLDPNILITLLFKRKEKNKSNLYIR
jgi:hypothetical protein